MEIAQLCKSAYNNRLQQSIYLCHTRTSQIWQVNTLWQSKKVTPRYTPTPPDQCPYEVSTFYTLWNPRNSQDKILKLMVTMIRSNQGHTMLHTYISYTLQFLRYSTDKILYVKITTVRLHQGHTMTVHTYNPIQCPYQVSTSNTLRFLRYSPDTVYWSRSLRQGPRSNQGHTMKLHTYTS